MTSAAVGLDVGGSLIKTVVLDGGEVVDSQRHPLPSADVIGVTEELARRLIDQTGALAVGIGVAGLVADGVFVWGPHVDGRAIDYRSEMSHRLRVPVAVDNDANLAALAEATIGAGCDHDPVLMLTFGTGIGAGLVVAGQIYRGRAFAGEVGHMILGEGGRSCACGGTGCWETEVSGTRLDQLALEVLGEGGGRHGRELANAARSGNAEALAAFRDLGTRLGRGIGNLVLALDPAVVVLGGGLMESSDLLVEHAIAEIARVVPGRPMRPETPLVVARFGVWSGAVGAALLARRTMELQ